MGASGRKLWRRKKGIGIGGTGNGTARPRKCATSTACDGDEEGVDEMEREVRMTRTCCDDEGADEKEWEVGMNIS